MNLTKEDVQEILRLLDGSPYDELHLETDRFTLTLKRSSGSTGGWTQERHTRNAPNVAATGQVGGPQANAATASATEPSAVADTGADIHEIHPHLPGTFYRAPKPGAAPFVEVGATVEANTVIGIIETMKLMNSAYAGAHGEIIEICVENGTPVERSDVLMRLRVEAE